MRSNGAAFPADDLPTLPESWRWTRLGDLVDQARGICYGIVQPGKHDASGVPMINSQDISDGAVASRIEFRVAKDLHARFKRSTIRGGEILLTLVGANFGRVAIAPDSWAGFNCSRAVGIIPVREHPEFVMFCLRSPLTRKFLDNWANTTAQPTFNLKEVANLPIPLPSVAEQKAIAAMLGALDDKINLNRRMNATLEAMARALFQSWFVDFDPVRAKLDGRKPIGLDPATAALFPNEFEDSELGPIPKGWTLEPVGEVVSCVGGGTPSTTEPKFWEGGTHCWATPKDLSLLRAPVLIDTERRITGDGVAKISSGLLPVGTLLLSSRAPVGYLAIATMSVAINQGFIAMKCNKRASNYFMLNWCRSNMAEIESRASGTTFAEISKQNFRPIPIILPPSEIMTVFTKTVAPLYERITLNVRQSRTLATLRDALLPKLLSGKLSVLGEPA
jgi:type I restriction enzyme S subunit